MRNRKMVCDAIIESGDFYELSINAQVLYMHMLLTADTRGYVNNIRKIVNSTDGLDSCDVNELISKKFVLKRGENLYLIKGWYIHNDIPTYVKNESTYLEDLRKLYFDENFAYTEHQTDKKVCDIIIHKKPYKENKNKNYNKNYNENNNENNNENELF